MPGEANTQNNVGEFKIVVQLELRAQGPWRPQYERIVHRTTTLTPCHPGADASLGDCCSLLVAGYLLIVLRRYRRDQKVVMGEGRERDLVAHAQRRCSKASTASGTTSAQLPDAA